jgi:DNA-binding NtrC family response regulator
LTSKRVLLVEPDAAFRMQLRRAASRLAYVDADPGAPIARTHLLAKPYDWLVTNIRLEAYNGLHLLYLAHAAGVRLAVLVYGDIVDVALAREAQQLGAFFESRDCVALTLATYLRGELPARDRRDPGHRGRRTIFRGGRRCSDIRIVAH